MDGLSSVALAGVLLGGAGVAVSQSIGPMEVGDDEFWYSGQRWLCTTSCGGKHLSMTEAK